MENFELLFSIFGMDFVSPWSKMLMFLRKYFNWNMSFCDPEIEGKQKNSISFEFLQCCNSLFARIKTSNLFFRS